MGTMDEINMDILSEMQQIGEDISQILECQYVYFVPGCSDANLRHPLLDVVPAIFMSAVCVGRACREEIWQQEQVQALCDLAIQSGQMQVLRVDKSLAELQGLGSIAALPLEVSGGALGIFLLGDARTEQFGAGERRLLYAVLSMHLPILEQVLWEQARLALRTNLKRAVKESSGEAWADDASGQLVRSEFVAMVGHELRAPLSVIKGYAALLQAYGGTAHQRLPSEQQQRYLATLVEQSDLLELLVNDLLDISRLQRGDLALRPRAVDVEPLCREVIRLGQLRAEQRAPGKYHLEGKFAAPLSPVWADAERLQQVLMNVLENAIKYSPEGGHIELSASMPGNQGEQVVMCVRDQGIGIPAKRMSDLFQPFERLERSTTANIAGVGMGLYLARKLVEAMNGNIELQSCEGRGTNVTIRLPAVRLNKRLATDAMVQASIL